MSDEVRTYVQLQEEMHKALLAQHPDWIDAEGEAPMLDLYDKRLAELIALFDSPAERAAA